jgi:hypothetical protein
MIRFNESGKIRKKMEMGKCLGNQAICYLGGGGVCQKIFFVKSVNIPTNGVPCFEWVGITKKYMREAHKNLLNFAKGHKARNKMCFSFYFFG